MGLNRKNGTLKGVTVIRYNSDIGEYEKTGAVGWHLSDGDFFIGVGEREEWNGYDVEIEISAKALKRFLNIKDNSPLAEPTLGIKSVTFAGEQSSTSFSDDPQRKRWIESYDF